MAKPAAAAGRGHPYPVREQGPVGKPGERIVERLPGEPLLGLLPIGDVLDLRDQVARRPVAVVDGRDVERDPYGMTLRVDVALLGPVAVSLALDQLAQSFQVRLDVVGMGDLAEGLPSELVLLVARDIAQGPIDALKAAAG